MHVVLDFFNLKDAIPLLLLIWLLRFVGHQMAGTDPTVTWWARGLAAAAFLLYAIVSIDVWRPTGAWSFLKLLIQATLAMGMIHGLARVTVPALCFLYLHLWMKPRERERVRAIDREREAERAKEERDAAEREQAERERPGEEERRRQEFLTNLPPPPTREELLAAAQQTYEAKLRVLAAAGLDDIELKAAQDKAKQQYLRELDGIL